MVMLAPSLGAAQDARQTVQEVQKRSNAQSQRYEGALRRQS